jgi:hypothetical protein
MLLIAAAPAAILFLAAEAIAILHPTAAAPIAKPTL